MICTSVLPPGKEAGNDWQGKSGLKQELQSNIELCTFYFWTVSAPANDCNFYQENQFSVTKQSFSLVTRVEREQVKG